MVINNTKKWLKLFIFEKYINHDGIIKHKILKFYSFESFEKFIYEYSLNFYNPQCIYEGVLASIMNNGTAIINFNNNHQLKFEISTTNYSRLCHNIGEYFNFIDKTINQAITNLQNTKFNYKEIQNG